MLSLMQPRLSHRSAHEIVRGNVVSLDGSPAAIVESCEEQGANMVVKLIGELPVLVNKDRRVSVFNNQYV